MQVILNRQGQEWLNSAFRTKCPVCADEIPGVVIRPPKKLQPYQYTKCAGCGTHRPEGLHTLAYKTRWSREYRKHFYRKGNQA